MGDLEIDDPNTFDAPEELAILDVRLEAAPGHRCRDIPDIYSPRDIARHHMSNPDPGRAGTVLTRLNQIRLYGRGCESIAGNCEPFDRIAAAPDPDHAGAAGD